jgi:alpha-amylase/alpha-mannosidase (GH57 family)
VFLKTNPSWPPPEQPFIYPQDASEQLRRAVALHQRLFGRTPTGLWPSEGSVSDAMVPLVAEAGFAWMATDEEILARSLPRTFARTPICIAPTGRRGTATVACGFRDHLLSDLVGFTYSSWDPQTAADDFVNRIAATGERYRAQSRRGRGHRVRGPRRRERLGALRRAGAPVPARAVRTVGTAPGVRTVTMAEACADAAERLPDIHPGSWINADFYIWIGHATIAARGASCRAPAARSSTPPAWPAPRRSRPRARSC